MLNEVEICIIFCLDSTTQTGRGRRYERPLSYEEHIYAEIEEDFEEGKWHQFVCLNIFYYNVETNKSIAFSEEYDKLNFAPCNSQGVSYNIPAQKNKNISLEPCMSSKEAKSEFTTFGFQI